MGVEVLHTEFGCNCEEVVVDSGAVQPEHQP
jgi:hypothetical protein